MIEIKERWSGKVLYTAKNAQDVRTAVREAVKSGADLSRADLSGANLYRANLSGADLSGANLYRANLSRANLYRANLSGANLYRANLSGADLSRANLSGADLSGANLYRADLSRANLYRANLYGANLSRATGVNPYLTTPLHILMDQPGKIRAYKLVTADGNGPIQGGITYEKGESVEVSEANTDPNIQCAAGINVATLDWCIREWRTGYRILVVEFSKKDIACIPTGSDGKFRLHRCRVVGEKDLGELGVVKEEEAVA